MIKNKEDNGRKETSIQHFYILNIKCIAYLCKSAHQKKKQKKALLTYQYI